MNDWTLAGIRGYYREHAGLIARQLDGRKVLLFPPAAGSVTVDSPAQLLALTDAGVGGFLISPERGDTGLIDRMIITLETGDGTDIAVTATTALAVADILQTHGQDAVTFLDGRGNLLMLLQCPPRNAESARNFLDGLLDDYATQAPELATTGDAAGDGGVRLSAHATSVSVFSWAPYSLVPGSAPGVVIPLHADDVAAASAGMPLDIGPQDVTGRLLLRGDLLG